MEYRWSCAPVPQFRLYIQGLWTAQAEVVHTMSTQASRYQGRAYFLVPNAGQDNVIYLDLDDALWAWEDVLEADPEHGDFVEERTIS